MHDFKGFTVHFLLLTVHSLLFLLGSGLDIGHFVYELEERAGTPLQDYDCVWIYHLYPEPSLRAKPPPLCPVFSSLVFFGHPGARISSVKIFVRVNRYPLSPIPCFVIHNSSFIIARSGPSNP